MLWLRSASLVVLSSWLLLSAGCFSDDTTFPAATLSTSTTGDGGSGGNLLGTGGGASVCESCAPAPPVPFERLTMFWIGAPGDAPDCPPDVPLTGFQGVADLSAAPASCPTCECSPAVCALPEAMHVSAAKCPADGAPATAWDAPAGWDGACTADPIPAGTLCGGVPCTQSLTIAAPTVAPCQPEAQGTASIAAPSWSTAVRECVIGPLARETCTTGEVCAPTPPDGFALCYFLTGDYPGVECPAGFEHGPLVVFDTWQDERACAPCACGEPEGADCLALASVFSDAACGSLAGSLLLANDEPGCVDLPAGSALGSKSAQLLVSQPGSCLPSGGAPVGAIEPIVPVTLCCQPAVDPAE